LRSSWHLVLLGLVAVGVVLAAVLELGPPSSSARTSREVVTAAKGVIQSTVTGSGNVEPGTDVEASFQTSGTLQHLYAKTGDHVVKGQLLATLDPTAAQNTLNQAESNLTSAQDQLTNAEDATVTTTTSLPVAGPSVQYVAFTTTPTTTTSTTTSTTSATPTTGSSTTSTLATPTTTTTTPAPTTATTPSRGSGAGDTSQSSGGASGSGGSGTSGSSGSTTSGETAATKAANIASAQASVDGAEASVITAETALHETHLYAPASGTVVSVQSVSSGDEISGSSSSSASSSSSGSTGASTGTATTSAGSLGSASSSSGASSGLVEIVNTAKMTMTVAFSESDISKIKVGQPATVTLDALTGVKLAAHVSAISTLGTTSSSVVSYDATLTLDQHDSRVKPGMSASAAVVTGQASGVTLPSSAITGTGAVSTVDRLRNGKSVPTRVVVGLKGDSRTQIVSGLSAGAQVVVTTSLPSLSSSASSSSGTLGGGTGSRRFGGSGGFGAGGGFAGGSGPVPGG
jgi:multidrug efflux pump subunit AcrA (membrane-fusion protein)